MRFHPYRKLLFSGLVHANAEIPTVRLRFSLLESRVHIQATREPCIGSLALDTAAVTVFHG